jgi:hypothetical protein
MLWGSRFQIQKLKYMQIFTIVQAFKVEKSYKMLMSSTILHMQTEKTWAFIPIFSSNETQSKTK